MITLSKYLKSEKKIGRFNVSKPEKKSIGQPTRPRSISDGKNTNYFLLKPN